MVERRIYAIGEEALGVVVRQMSGSSQTTQYGGQGGDGGGLGPRIAKLEAAVEHIQSDMKETRDDIRAMKTDARNDFRILFGAIIVVALGLAGVMAKGFKWL